MNPFQNVTVVGSPLAVAAPGGDAGGGAASDADSGAGGDGTSSAETTSEHVNPLARRDVWKFTTLHTTM